MDSRISRTAYLALALGVFCIGTSAIFVKIAAVPGTVSAFYRVFFVNQRAQNKPLHDAYTKPA